MDAPAAGVDPALHQARIQAISPEDVLSDGPLWKYLPKSARPEYLRAIRPVYEAYSIAKKANDGVGKYVALSAMLTQQKKLLKKSRRGSGKRTRQALRSNIRSYLAARGGDQENDVQGLLRPEEEEALLAAAKRSAEAALAREHASEEFLKKQAEARALAFKIFRAKELVERGHLSRATRTLLQDKKPAEATGSYPEPQGPPPLSSPWPRHPPSAC